MPHSHGFKMINTLSPSDLVENLRHLVGMVWRDQNRDWLPDQLLGRVAIDPLRARIPAYDRAIQALADDRIIRGLHNGGQSGKTFARLPPLDHFLSFHFVGGLK